MPTRRFLEIVLSGPDSQPLACQAAYLEVGQGPALVMLHGFMGSAVTWWPLMQKLQSHYRCISLDLLGFGKSAKPALRYNIALEVAFVSQVLKALSLEPCYLLGHSFGGWIGATYALKYPQALQGLILAAPAGIRDDSFRDRWQLLKPLLWPSPLVDWGLGLATPLAGLLGKQAEFQKLRWYRQSLKEQPVASSFLRDRLRPEAAVDTVEQEIHRLQLPTLVISGDQDETIPLWHSQTYANQIPQAQLAIIPGASHSLPQNHSGEIAKLILTFMAKNLPVDRQKQESSGVSGE